MKTSGPADNRLNKQKSRCSPVDNYAFLPCDLHCILDFADFELVQDPTFWFHYLSNGLIMSVISPDWTPEELLLYKTLLRLLK